MTASLLTSIECPELIASSKQEYKGIAVRLGSDSEYLKATRSKVWSALEKSSIFDCAQQAKDLEKLYRKMWKRYENEIVPDHILGECEN